MYSYQAARILEQLIAEIDQAYIPKAQDQDRLAALRLAIQALEKARRFKGLDEAGS